MSGENNTNTFKQICKKKNSKTNKQEVDCESAVLQRDDVCSSHLAFIHTLVNMNLLNLREKVKKKTKKKEKAELERTSLFTQNGAVIYKTNVQRCVEKT